jgi:hypothetical protein
MKKYSYILIILLLVGAYATLLALIFGEVQGIIIPLVVAIVLVVMVVVISIVVGSGRPDGIPEVFNAIGGGLAHIIQAGNKPRKQNKPK